MSLSLYKPNSKNTGCAFNFRSGINKKQEPVIYISAIQQYSWDDNKKTANFSGNRDDSDKNINVKFNEFEIGGMISAFKKRHEYSTFHAYDENKTSIKLTPWDKKNKEGKIFPAFGITFLRNGNQSFKLPIEPGEVETLICFFESYLRDLFTFRKKEEIKNRMEQKKNQQSEPPSEAPF